MKYNEMIKALDEARKTQELAKNQMTNMASLLCGNLRMVKGFSDYKWERDSKILAQLKRELRDYNISTGKWREEK